MKRIVLCLMGPLFPLLNHVKLLYLCKPLIVLHLHLAIVVDYGYLYVPDVSNKMSYFIHNGPEEVP